MNVASSPKDYTYSNIQAPPFLQVLVQVLD